MKASEKQINFINNLSEKKTINEMAICQLEADLEDINGNRVNIDLNDIENLEMNVASKIIEMLLKAPTKERNTNHQKKYESNINKYEKLIAWAKENHVQGVREKMKKANVLLKIKEAGLNVPEELL